METIDLDINNYELKDILSLFKLQDDFNENDLKKAKQIVLKMHPDKSKLDAKYFLFFSRAYKTLYSIYNYKNKSSSKKINDYRKYDINDYKEKNDALNDFFDKNEKFKNPNDFNKWFNKQFEKNKLYTETETKGYGDWLRSEDDLEPEKNISLSSMASEFEKKKREIQSVIIHKDVTDMYYNNINASNVTGEAPEEFNSDLFSNLQYQDLRKAHKESVIPVTEDDYNSVKKFRNINEYTSYRNNQDVKPLSEIQAMEYLKNKNKISESESNARAYTLAKQLEDSKKKNNDFWSNIYKITI
jgi:hypothetical protein